MKKILISILLMISISCTHDKTNVIIKNEQNLSMQEIKFSNEASPLFPRGCLIKDSLLIVFEPKDKVGFLHIYNKNDYSFIRKIGHKGDGPNEFVRPRFMVNINTQTDNKILIGDIDGLFSLDISSDSIVKNKEIIFPANLETYNYVLQNSNDTLIVNQTREHQLSVYDKKNDKLLFKDYYDEDLLNGNFSDFAKVNIIYDAYFTSNEDFILISYKHFKVIDLISKETLKLVNRIYFPGYNSNQLFFTKKNEHVTIDNDSKLFFTYAYPTNNGFFVLSLDAKRSEIEEGNATPIIYEISNKGMINSIYNLDKAISNFIIEENAIYAIGLSDESGELGLFKGDICKTTNLTHD